MSRSLAGRVLGIFLLVSLASAQMKLVNLTIDDQLGDEVTGRLVDYSPPGIWTQGNGCDYCAARPDNNSAFDGTWHDGSRDPNRDPQPLALSLKFNGTAIYLYNILIKLVLTDVNITVDGKLANRFTLTPNITQQYQYESLVFSQDNLTYGEHTVQMSAFGPDQTTVLFDYAVYSTNVTDSSSSSSPSPTGSTSGNDTTTSSHKSNAGPIAGGVVGGLAVIVILILGYLLYKRRSRPPAIVPFEQDDRGEKKDILEDRSLPSQSFVPPLVLDGSSEEIRDSSRSESSQASDESLRQTVQNLREQLDLMRAERGIPGVSANPSHYSSVSSSQKASPLALEVQSLRQEIQQLRSQQSSVFSPPTSPASSDVMREIAFLRAEMDEMRLQQEIIQGPLPSYSPPARPLPGFPVPDPSS